MLMGIIRIRHRGACKDDIALHCPLTIDEFLQEGSPLLPKDHSSELDDPELSDTGCEYALVDENFCSVPYELFGLPNLKEILSLETWNLYLTEEERFHLAAYLPDMDQETFCLTISELLGGANFFFSSPLETLFHRLRGGFYSVQVSQFREGLKLLYRRLYYHSLRSYHERMSQKIIEMRTTRSNCQPSTSVEERVQNLNNKSSQQPVLLVDLNAVPPDEELSSQREKGITGLINNEVSTHVHAMYWNGKASNRTKAKGVLKIKPLEMNSTSKNHTVLPFYKESRESFKRPPKGVLKIKPKGYATTLIERPTAITYAPDSSSDTAFGVPPPSVSQWEKSLNTKLTFQHHSHHDESSSKGLLTPELSSSHQSKETRNIGSRQIDNGRTYLTKMMGVKGIAMHCDGRTDFGECFGDRHSKASCTTSASFYNSAPDRHLRKIMQVHAMSEAVSRNSIDEYQMFPRHGERMFPMMYKRKKPYTKCSAVENFQKPSAVASAIEPLSSAAPDLHHEEKARSVKVGVRGWCEFTSQ